MAAREGAGKGDREGAGQVSLDGAVVLAFTTMLANQLPLGEWLAGRLGERAATAFLGQPGTWLVAASATLLAILYVASDVLGAGLPAVRRVALKRALLGAIAALVVVLPLLVLVHARSSRPGGADEFDGLVQTELATALLLEGRDPYTEDYGGTAMDTGRYDGAFLPLGYRRNPALAHFVYPPLVLVLSLPVSIAMERTVGWFDARVPLLAAYLALWLLVPRLARDPSRSLLLSALVLLNPMMVPWMLAGYNDVLVLACLAASLACAREGRQVGAGVAAGLAICAKQLAWLYLPFLLVHAAGRPGPGPRTLARALGDGVRSPAARWTLLTVLAVMGPFLLWDARGLADDVLLYEEGLSEESYPLRGAYSFGIGSLLLFLGVAEPRPPFPLWALHAAITLPAALLLLGRQARAHRFADLCTGFAFTLLAGSFLMRSLHYNHLGLAFAMLSVAACAER